MTIDEIIKTLCEEAETFKIRMVVNDRCGGIFLKKKLIELNPVYDINETFIHEMLHYYVNNIECINMGMSEEFYVENRMKILMNNKDNKRYVNNYLNSRL